MYDVHFAVKAGFVLLLLIPWLCFYSDLPYSWWKLLLWKAL